MNIRPSFLRFLPLLVLTELTGCSHRSSSPLKEGDLVFQTTHSKQSGAILLATHAKYGHVGLVLNVNGTLMVFEAVGPVKYTPIEDWISHGKGNMFAVRRLKDSTLLFDGAIRRMEHEAAAMIGKPYDLAFDWSDDKMYCSEAVWKVFDRGAGIELCKPSPLKSFDLSSSMVQAVLKTRYGGQIPYDEPMVSPQQLYSSILLYTVCEQ